MEKLYINFLILKKRTEEYIESLENYIEKLERKKDSLPKTKANISKLKKKLEMLKIFYSNYLNVEAQTIQSMEIEDILKIYEKMRRFGVKRIEGLSDDEVFNELVEIEEVIQVKGYNPGIPKSMMKGFLKLGIVEGYRDKDGKIKYRVSIKNLSSIITSNGNEIVIKYEKCVKELIGLIKQLEKSKEELEVYKKYLVRKYLTSTPAPELIERGELTLERDTDIVSEFDVADSIYEKLYECLSYIQSLNYIAYQDILEGIIKENLQGTDIEGFVKKINGRISDINAKWKKYSSEKDITGEMIHIEAIMTFIEYMQKYMQEYAQERKTNDKSTKEGMIEQLTRKLEELWKKKRRRRE